VQMPTSLPAIQRQFQTNNSFFDVFRQLDLNGDGKVTLGEILGFKGDNTGTLGDLLPAVSEAMHLGAAGENYQAFGVTRGMLRSDADDSVFFRASIKDGTSNTVAFAQSPVPAISLAGFCDGSARRAFGDGSVRHSGDDGPEESHFDRQFRGGSLFSSLAPVQPGNNTAYTGPVTFNDGSGNGIIAILIGLLQPSLNGGTRLDGIVIAQQGTGFLAGAPGTGVVTINWGDATLQGPFDASLQLTPFNSSGKH